MVGVNYLENIANSSFNN